jgi:4-amino-4-deoxy-L-arabinose transferase-like glycosyltransferase
MLGNLRSRLDAPNVETNERKEVRWVSQRRRQAMSTRTNQGQPRRARVHTPRQLPGRWEAILTLTGLWAIIYLPRLFSPGIFDDSDAMYAEVPREMLLRGDWITPHANSIRYLEKPPLYYWLVAAGYRAFGVTTASARLPGAVVCLGIILASYALGELLFDVAAGWIAGATMATSAGFYLFTQQLMPDPLLTLLLAVSFYCFLRGEGALAVGQRGTGERTAVASHPPENLQNPGDHWFLLSFGSIGLAVLAKGLIGLIFPVLTLGPYAILRRREGQPVRPPLGRGLLLFAAIALPWHLLVGLRNPGWAWFYFVNEHLLRFLNRRVPRDYGTVPLAAFWLLHFIWLFPWSLFLPAALTAVWQEFRGRRPRTGFSTDTGADSAPPPEPGRRLPLAMPAKKSLLFPMLWAGSVLLFFSFSTRLEYYSMPAFPALALLIGATASRNSRRTGNAQRSRLLLGSCWGAVAVTAMGLLAAVALAIMNARTPAKPPRPLYSPASAYSVYFFSPVLGISVDQLRRVVGPALGVTLSAFAGSVAALALLRRGRLAWIGCALALAMIPCLASLQRCVAAFEDDISSRRLAETINRIWRPGDLLVVDGQYETFNSLNFYTQHPLHILDARRGYLEYGSRYLDAPKLFLDRATFAHLLAHPGAGRVLLVTRSPQHFPIVAAQPRCLSQLGGKSLLVYDGRYALAQAYRGQNPRPTR